MSKFAYVGDPEKTETWHLPIHDESHVRNALARFNQADIPADKKQAVARRLVRAAKSYDIDTRGFEEKYLRELGIGNQRPVIPKHLATLLTSLPVPVKRDGKELFELPIAVTGTWVKNGCEFSITHEDLANIARNFEKRKNDQVVIDYEHASEMPEIARGGPVPAAGWIHELRMSSRSNAGSSKNGHAELCALVEWTPDAKEMIRKGQYRFFSPAIDWSASDKETGEPQGATLTSGALTNHPFLEELPPIMLNEFQISNLTLQMQEMAGIHQDGFLQNVSVAYGKTEDGNQKSASTNDSGGKTVAKKLTFKKLAGAPGKRRVFDDSGAELGDISLDELDLDDAELEELMAQRGGPAGKMDDTLSELMSEAETDDREELKRLLRPAKQLGAERIERAARVALLSETLKDGAINLDIAAKLADQGRIGFSDYRAVQKAHGLVEKAIVDGKFLPADREFISRLALSEPEKFEIWARKKPRAVQLGGPTGVSGSAPENPAQELSLRLSELMREKNLDRHRALQELAQSDVELIRRWRWGTRRDVTA